MAEQRLREAAVQGDLAAVEDALDGNPDLVDAPLDEAGNTALHLAATHGHLAVAQFLLLDKGADYGRKVRVPDPGGEHGSRPVDDLIRIYPTGQGRPNRVDQRRTKELSVDRPAFEGEVRPTRLLWTHAYRRLT